MIEGRLRYLLCRESCITPRMSNVSIFFSLGVLALEKIQDLSVLIFWPQAASYNRRISIRCQHSWLLTLQNKKRRSSAKKKKWDVRAWGSHFSSCIQKIKILYHNYSLNVVINHIWKRNKLIIMELLRYDILLASSLLFISLWSINWRSFGRFVRCCRIKIKLIVSPTCLSRATTC